MTSTRVFVGGLPQDARERDVEKFFRGYGRIKEIAMKSGFCFVEFADQQDADDAIQDLNDMKLLGRRVVVENSRKPRNWDQNVSRRRFSRNDHRFSPARRTDFRVIVENLSTRIQWQDLKDFMTKVGKVTYAKAHNIRPNQGMAEFDTYEDMKRVIRELNGSELKGRKIVIKEAARLSRSRSRSPVGRRRLLSRSRSRSPIGRSRSPVSRTRRVSRSRSPVGKAKWHSRSRSPVDRPRLLSRSHSQVGRPSSPIRSRSPIKSRSPIRSRSPVSRTTRASRSQSPVAKIKSHSRSRSPLDKAKSYSRSSSATRENSEERSEAGNLA